MAVLCQLSYEGKPVLYPLTCRNRSSRDPAWPFPTDRPDLLTRRARESGFFSFCRELAGIRAEAVEVEAGILACSVPQAIRDVPGDEEEEFCGHL